MKAWTCCPHLQEQGKKKPRAPLCQENKGVAGKAPKNSPHVHTFVPKTTPQKCHSQVSSPFPYSGNTGRRLKFCKLQKLGGSLQHNSRTGMDSGDAAQESQAGICWPIRCYPSLQHFWAFLCALGSHPQKEHKSHWRIPCRFCVLQTRHRFF